MNGSCDKDEALRGLISYTAEYLSENKFDNAKVLKQVNLVLQLYFKNIIRNSAQQEFG